MDEAEHAIWENFLGYMDSIAKTLESIDDHLKEILTDGIHVAVNITGDERE